MAECGASYHADVQPKDAPNLLQLFLSEQASGDIFAQAFKVSKLQQALLGHLKVVEAAGGLVRNEHGHNLLIFRNGFWDLPKGKIEPGESRKLAALREVMEETGVNRPSLGPLITRTYHIYNQGGIKHLKLTYWYAMSLHGPQPLAPQTEEGIEEVRWMPDIDMPSVTRHLYRNIAEVYTEACKMLYRWDEPTDTPSPTDD